MFLVDLALALLRRPVGRHRAGQFDMSLAELFNLEGNSLSIAASILRDNQLFQVWVSRCPGLQIVSIDVMSESLLPPLPAQ